LPLSGRQQGGGDAFTGMGLDFLPVHDNGNRGCALDFADPLGFQANSMGIANLLSRATG
jgi:hypothetical protein